MSTVTVLMPVYNGTRYLREAIDSILKQTFEDFEFLIIDDASTDESASVILSYSDERIRFVQNESNVGQVRCQNIGLDLARGQYIATLDQDDSSLATRLQRQVALIDSDHRLAVVGTWMSKVDENGHEIDLWLGKVDDYADYLFTSLTNSLPLYHPSVMFRRDAVMSVNGYDESLPYCEDQDLWRRLALAGYEARVIPEPLTRYRIHVGQQSVSKANIQSDNMIFALERFMKAFVDEDAVRPLRLLMTCESILGAEFWDICSSPKVTKEYCQYLTKMLGEIRRKLQLTHTHYSKLEYLIRRHAAYVSLRAWRSSISRQWGASLPMYIFALKGGSSVAFKYHVWIYPIVYIMAPVLLFLRTIKRLASRSLYIQRCYSSIKQITKRSDTIRHWYRKIRYFNTT